MNLIVLSKAVYELSKIMASYQRAIKTLSYKSDEM